MEFVPRTQIYHMFELLSHLNIEWILLRNTNNELPNRLRILKDIDILVKPNDAPKLRTYFQASNYKIIEHPDLKFCSIADESFKLDYYSGDLFNLDVCDVLYYCNLQRTKFYPINNTISMCPWESYSTTKFEDYELRVMDTKTFLVANILRCILWKRHISSYYLKVIKSCLSEVSLNDFISLFYPFFENYSEQIYWDFKNCNVRDTIMNFHKHLGMIDRIPRSIM